MHNFDVVVIVGWMLLATATAGSFFIFSFSTGVSFIELIIGWLFRSSPTIFFFFNKKNYTHMPISLQPVGFLFLHTGHSLVCWLMMLMNISYRYVVNNNANVKNKS